MSAPVMQHDQTAAGVAIGQLELPSQVLISPTVPTTTRRARHDSNVSAAECIVRLEYRRLLVVQTPLHVVPRRRVRRP
jgi:hypothetical protein